jgi:hypothetical protein
MEPTMVISTGTRQSPPRQETDELCGRRLRPIAAFLAATCACTADAVTVPVTNCDDHGAGSLRDALEQSALNPGFTFDIDMTALACSTITLDTGALISYAYYTTLHGPTSHALTIDGSNNGRVLVHNGKHTMTLNDLAIVHGDYSGYYGGGCVYAYGNLELNRSTVSNCTLTPSTTTSHGGGALFARGFVKLSYSTLRDSTVHGEGSYAAGGGVEAEAGPIDVDSSTISGNTAPFAAGLLIHAPVYFHSPIPIHVRNSTISGNHATQRIGGIYSQGPLGLYNSTIAFNTEDQKFGGAGIYAYSTTHLVSTIVANNTSTQNGADYDLLCKLPGAFCTVSGSNNLIMVSNAAPPDTLTGDPQLAPLANNGGPTQTHALMIGSPAIDAGANFFFFTYDQRGTGFARVVGTHADIGAYEVPDEIFASGFD